MLVFFRTSLCRNLLTSLASNGANHVTGGVLKSTLVVDNGSVHTYTACFQSLSLDHLLSLIH